MLNSSLVLFPETTDFVDYYKFLIQDSHDCLIFKNLFRSIVHYSKNVQAQYFNFIRSFSLLNKLSLKYAYYFFGILMCRNSQSCLNPSSKVSDIYLISTTGIIDRRISKNFYLRSQQLQGLLALLRGT